METLSQTQRAALQPTQRLGSLLLLLQGKKHNAPICIMIMSWIEGKTPQLCAKYTKNTG